MEKETIELYGNSDQQLNNAIDKIIVSTINKKSKYKQGQVIAVTGCSPLVGTTSLTINLSIAMAATGRKTVLVDCDIRKNAKYKKLNDNARMGLADYISSQSESEELDDIVYSTNFDALCYVPCGETDENPARILCSGRMERVIKILNESFDCVILDCPSISVVPDALVLFGKVDGIVVVSALGETKRSQIKDVNRLIAPFKEKYYGMIINKVPKDLFKQAVKNSDYYLLDKAGRQRFEKTKAFKKRQKMLLQEQKKADAIAKEGTITE